MKKWFYYFRDAKKRPVVTVCLLKDTATGQVARGVAICSRRDMPRKKTGRSIAEGRAGKAMITGTWEPYGGNSSAMSVAIGAGALLVGGDVGACKWHGYPALTEFEQKLVREGV